MADVVFQGFDAAPAALQAESGMVASGRFAGAIADTNTQVWDGTGGWGSPRRWRRKAWLYGGVYHADYLIGCAVADAGYLGSAFVYVYERASGRMTEYAAMRPGYFAADFAPDSQSGWQFAAAGKHWHIGRLPEQNGWRFQVQAGEQTELVLDLVGGEDAVCAVNGWPSRPLHYTLKAGALQARVHWRQGEVVRDFNATGVVDFSLGYPPRHTHWQWACLSGQFADGRLFGCNLVAQFMNGLENTVWLDDGNGQRHVLALAQAVFEYDGRDIQRPWQIHTQDGRLRLQFVPEGMRREHIHLGVLASRFAQPCGRFSGHWRDADGSWQPVAGFGVVEQHAATW